MCISRERTFCSLCRCGRAYLPLKCRCVFPKFLFFLFSFSLELRGPSPWFLREKYWHNLHEIGNSPWWYSHAGFRMHLLFLSGEPGKQLRHLMFCSQGIRGFPLEQAHARTAGSTERRQRSVLKGFLCSLAPHSSASSSALLFLGDICSQTSNFMSVNFWKLY